MAVYFVSTWFVGALISAIILALAPKSRKYIIKHDHQRTDLEPDEVVGFAILWPALILWPISLVISFVLTILILAPEYFVTKIWRV